MVSKIVGARVHRVVGSDVYLGTVKCTWHDVTTDETLYRISYDDGDMEDMNEIELISCLPGGESNAL